MRTRTIVAVAAAGAALALVPMVDHGGAPAGDTRPPGARAPRDGRTSPAPTSEPGNLTRSTRASSPSPTPGATEPPPRFPASPQVTPEGFLVAAGTGPLVGSAEATLVTFTVEVDPRTQRGLDEVVPVVLATLQDPDRGWTATGLWAVQRVDDPATADVRVVLATPDTVDTYCGLQEVETNGIYSCWDGTRAMLNLWRWDHGARDFEGDVDTYRTYQVNHEVGHALGQDHRDCPGPGEPAPIMMQQTRTVGDCVPNGWPYPEGTEFPREGGRP